MEPFEIAGNVAGTALMFKPTGDGRLFMTVMHWHTSRHDSVILRPDFLRPLAAWFAGEAEPGCIGDAAPSRLHIAGDEAAGVYNPRVGARLRCPAPYGPATVAVGVLRGRSELLVTLSPEARAEVAAYLRRVDAAHWVKPAV